MANASASVRAAPAQVPALSQQELAECYQRDSLASLMPVDEAAPSLDRKAEGMPVSPTRGAAIEGQATDAAPNGDAVAIATVALASPSAASIPTSPGSVTGSAASVSVTLTDLRSTTGTAGSQPPSPAASASVPGASPGSPQLAPSAADSLTEGDIVIYRGQGGEEGKGEIVKRYDKTRFKVRINNEIKLLREAHLRKIDMREQLLRSPFLGHLRALEPTTRQLNIAAAQEHVDPDVLKDVVLGGSANQEDILANVSGRVLREQRRETNRAVNSMMSAMAVTTRIVKRMNAPSVAAEAAKRLKTACSPNQDAKSGRENASAHAAEMWNAIKTRTAKTVSQCQP